MKAVLVGATRGMGRALARLLAERGAAIFLLGRDARELAASARDLEARGAPGPVGTALLDLAAPAGFGPALDAADGALARFDTLVVTGGLFGRTDELAWLERRSRAACRLRAGVKRPHSEIACGATAGIF